MTDFVVRVAGEAGEGPTTIGDFLARSAARSGYSVYTFQTFPAEIRGGHAYLQTRISEQTTLSYGNRPDILLALNEDAFNRWAGLVPTDGLVMYDSSRFHVPGDLPFHAIGVPGENLAVSEVGNKIAQNVVMFGALAGLVHLDQAIAEVLIRDRWKSKGQEVVASNLKAFEIGMRLTRDQEHRAFHPAAHPARRRRGTRHPHGQRRPCASVPWPRACVISAGTPSPRQRRSWNGSGGHLPAFGGTVMQLEDEIAAIGSVLGASSGGVKSMTSTSGPGLSLMVELLGLASMAEVPLVVVDVQRAGPSTGMATKTAQGDLNLALYGAHGDAPRVVMAATSVEDSFYTTMHAFNLAERLQVPVILLSDQALITRISSVPLLDPARVRVENRLAFTPNGDGAFSALPYDRERREPCGAPRHARVHVHRYRPRARRAWQPERRARQPHGDAGQACAEDGTRAGRAGRAGALVGRSRGHDRGDRLGEHRGGHPRGCRNGPGGGACRHRPPSPPAPAPAHGPRAAPAFAVPACAGPREQPFRAICALSPVPVLRPVGR